MSYLFGHAHVSITQPPLLPLPSYLHRGELPEGAAAEYETSRKNYEALHRGVSSMAEALGKPLPQLAEDAFTRIGHEEAAVGGAGSAGGAGDAVEHVFEDPEVRASGQCLWGLASSMSPKGDQMHWRDCVRVLRHNDCMPQAVVNEPEASTLVPR